MNTIAMRTVALSVFLLGCAVALGEDEKVSAAVKATEKKILAAADKVKSFSADVAMEMDMTSGPMSMKSDGRGKIEGMRKDDKFLARFEMTNKLKMGGENGNTMEQSMLMIHDGEFTYSLMEQFGQKMAMKSKESSDISGITTAESFENLHEQYELKTLPDESVNGEDTWVLEGKLKKPNPSAGDTRLFFSKKHGLLIKMITEKPDSEDAMQTMSLRNIKMNVDLKPERFVFKAPEGVVVRDMTKAPSAGPGAP